MINCLSAGATNWCPQIMQKKLQCLCGKSWIDLKPYLSSQNPLTRRRNICRFVLQPVIFFAELLMPLLAKDMALAAPNIQPKLIDLVPHRYIETVERELSDLALIPDEPVGNWAEKKILFRSSFAAIARRNHPAIQGAGIAAGDMMPLDLFCDLRHALFSPEGNSSAMGDAALARLGRSRKVGMTLQVFSGVCRVVSESDMIALIPWQLGQKWADQMQLDIFIPPMHIPIVKIVGVWHKRSTNNPAHRWVREQIFDEMKKLDAMQPDLTAWPQAWGGGARD